MKNIKTGLEVLQEEEVNLIKNILDNTENYENMDIFQLKHAMRILRIFLKNLID